MNHRQFFSNERIHLIFYDFQAYKWQRIELTLSIICQFQFYMKMAKSQFDAFVREDVNLTMAHWIRLSLLCRCK